MTVIIHQITAVLDMPDEYLEQSKRAGDIITACTGNPNVTVPAPVLVAANTALNNFKTAATPGARTAALRPLRNALKAIMSLFQIVADNDPANSEVIILSGNFKVKKIALNQKHAFELSNGINSGTVDMEAEGALRIPATTGYIRPMASILHEFRPLWLPIPTWTTFL